MNDKKNNEPHSVSPENAQRILEWLRTRGGIALWPSIDLSDLDKSWTTPLKQENGEPALKPHWKADSKPNRIITDPAEVVVDIPKEVKRFHVAIRRSSNGLSLKLTDGSTRRLRGYCDKFGEQYKDRGGCWYEFDYSTQEAVIYVADQRIPILEWEELNKIKSSTEGLRA